MGFCGNLGKPLFTSLFRSSAFLSPKRVITYLCLSKASLSNMSRDLFVCLLCSYVLALVFPSIYSDWCLWVPLCPWSRCLLVPRCPVSIKSEPNWGWAWKQVKYLSWAGLELGRKCNFQARLYAQARKKNLVLRWARARHQQTHFWLNTPGLGVPLYPLSRPKEVPQFHMSRCLGAHM